jgi:6-phosphogluconolactonase
MSSPALQILILPTSADLFRSVADEFLRVGRTAIGAQGRFTVALSGGSTPRALYALLAKDHTDFTWARTHLFFGDERHVPPDHSDSNYRMVNESLLSRIQIPAENLHRVHTENADAKQAAADYEAEIHKFFELRRGELPRFDLILLAWIIHEVSSQKRKDALKG